jgi:hypothetical protein
VQTHHINVSRARDMAQEIRHELFAFPEVLDVFVTGRPDWLVVVSRGRPRPAEWLRALRAVGYDIPPRRHAVAGPAEADRPEPAAAPARPLAAVRGWSTGLPSGHPAGRPCPDPARGGAAARVAGQDRLPERTLRPVGAAAAVSSAARLKSLVYVRDLA